MIRWSIQRRVIVVSAVVLAVAIAVFTLLSVSRMRATLVDRTDEELAAVASGLQVIARQQADRLELGEPPLKYKRLLNFQLPETFTGFAEVIDAEGDTAPLPRLARDDGIDPVVPDGFRDRADQPPFTVAGPNGDFRMRVVGLDGTGAVMVVALSLETTNAAIHDIARTEVLTGIALVLLLLVVLIVSLRLSLRPLAGIGRVASRIAAGHSGERAGPAARGTEIGELTAALNQMLDTVERSAAERAEALQRTEQFAADAAHELRTPVTAVLGYAQLYRRGGVGPDRLDDVFGRIEREGQRLRDLVDGLLVLNRLDGVGRGRDAAADSQDVDLAELSAEAAADAMAIDSRWPVTLETAGDAAPVARANRDELFQIVANLLSNVRSHTRPGTSTVITVDRLTDDDAVQLRIADDGQGIPDVDRPHVFERFYRVDGARRHGSTMAGTSTGGTGLGLAIVAALATRNGGSVSLADKAPEETGTTVVVVLPASHGPRSGAEHAHVQNGSALGGRMPE